MTCPQCAAAERNPLLGLYARECLSCKARALAHSHDLWESSRNGKLTDRYREVLLSIWGPDGWRAGHAEVKRWHERLEVCRARPAAAPQPVTTQP